MKTFILFTIIVILLLPIQMFSQVNDKLELRKDNLLQERIIPHSISDEQISHPSESDIFKAKKSRTLVNKTILDNGFLLTEELYQQWDGSNWVNNWKQSYTYDVNNNEIEQLRQEWDGSNWVNDRIWSYTYDGNNRIESVVQRWDGSNWVNDFKSIYTYDGNNNRIEELEQWWDDSNWMNYEKYTYIYDVYNNMIEMLAQWWDDSNWANGSKMTYTYDGNNNMIEKLWQDWNGSNWVNVERTTYSYIITGVEQLTDGIKTYSLSNNYPNPFNPSTIISYSVPEIEFVTLKVYDVLGSEVATLVNEEKSVGSYEVEFYGTEIVSGIYFYRLQAGNFIETKKMVLMK